MGCLFELPAYYVTPALILLFRAKLKILLENPLFDDCSLGWLAQFCIVEGQLALQMSLGKAAKGGPSNTK